MSKLWYVFLALLGLSIAVTVGSAAESVTDTRPDYVSCDYNETELQTYNPSLQTDHLSTEPANIYSTYCQSTESEEDVAVYFAYYTHQSGFTSEDSHQLDREPIYVFIDEDTGEVNRTVYSQYHYIKQEDTDPVTVDNTHVSMYVFTPHHHYRPQEGVVTQYELRDLSEVHQDWHNNEWSADIDVTANPYAIDETDSWWDEDNAAWDYRASEWYWELRLEIDSITPDFDLI